MQLFRCVSKFPKNIKSNSYFLGRQNDMDCNYLVVLLTGTDSNVRGSVLFATQHRKM